MTIQEDPVKNTYFEVISELSISLNILTNRQLRNILKFLNILIGSTFSQTCPMHLFLKDKKVVICISCFKYFLSTELVCPMHGPGTGDQE